MNDKYKITDVYKNTHGRTLYRIQALKNFADVKVGDVGGFIESENNLVISGTCWVYDDAEVYGRAEVSDSAEVRNRASIYGEAKVLNSAIVKDEGEVYGSAVVGGNAIVEDNALVYGTAYVSGNVRIGRGTHIDRGVYSNDDIIVGNKSRKPASPERKQVKVKQQDNGIIYKDIEW